MSSRHQTSWSRAMAYRFLSCVVELDRLREDLENDCKNLNAWSHRKYVVTRFYHELLRTYVSNCLSSSGSLHHLWACIDQGTRNSCTSQNVGSSEDSPFMIKTVDGCEGCWLVRELDFADEMIEQDCRNNTAWCFRYAVRKSLVKSLGHLSQETRKALTRFLYDEFKYTLEWCQKCPHNESAWNVLQSFFPTEAMILNHSESECRPKACDGIPCSNYKTSNLGQSYKTNDLRIRISWQDTAVGDEIVSAMNKILDSDPRNRFPLYIMYLVHLSKGDLVNAKKLLDGLSKSDPIRRRYWCYRSSLLERQLLTT